MSQPDHARESTWPSLSEQAQDSGPASASKIKMPKERTDISNPSFDETMRPKPQSRSKSSKTWKPLDLSSEVGDGGSIAEEISSLRHTPFDVHARIFQPSAPPTGPASQIPTGPSSQVPFTRPPTVMSETSVEDGFQLITGRRFKATGLNARQVEPEVRQTTVAATYNQTELNEVFGNTLPSPDFCASNVGSKNGQVQFCMHPNGDISAHQWSTTQYQWLNIGQFSNIRKRTEGQLASERLKGETEQQSLQQHSLAYFRAVAKQREAAMMNLSFGAKEIQACLPKLIPANTQSATIRNTSEMSVQQPESQSTPSSANAWWARMHLSSMYQGMPSAHGTATGHSAYNDSAARYESSYAGIQNVSRRNYRSRGGEYHTPSETQQPLTFGSMPSPSGKKGTGARSSVNLPLTFDGGSPMNVEDASDHSMSNDLAESLNANTFSERWYRMSHKSKTQLPGIDADDQPLLSPANPRGYEALQSGRLSACSDSQAKRPTLTDFLSRKSDTPSLRPTKDQQRTVLHDPFRTLSVDETSPTAARKSRSTDQTTLISLRRNTTPSRQGSPEWFDRSDPVRPPPGLFPSQDTRGFQHDLSPEATEALYHHKSEHFQNPPPLQMDLGPSNGPTPQSLADRPRPNENGFGLSNEALAKRDRELSEWLRSGDKTAERHEDFYNSIRSVDISKTPRQLDIGVIGRPSAKDRAIKEAGAKAAREEDDSLARLLIPVLENLSAYTQGPPEKRYGHWVPWTTPPEWCTDKSTRGRQSFFGEQWCAPPQRIGRDERYRATGGPLRFMNHDSATSILPARQMTDGRSRLGSRSPF